MPRIPAAIAVVMLVATCIGFNTARFPVVLEMAAVPEMSSQTRVVLCSESSAETEESTTSSDDLYSEAKEDKQKSSYGRHSSRSGRESDDSDGKSGSGYKSYSSYGSYEADDAGSGKSDEKESSGNRSYSSNGYGYGYAQDKSATARDTAPYSDSYGYGNDDSSDDKGSSSYEYGYKAGSEKSSDDSDSKGDPSTGNSNRRDRNRSKGQSAGPSGNVKSQDNTAATKSPYSRQNPSDEESNSFSDYDPYGSGSADSGKYDTYAQSDPYGSHDSEEDQNNDSPYSYKAPSSNDRSKATHHDEEDAYSYGSSPAYGGKTNVYDKNNRQDASRGDSYANGSSYDDHDSLARYGERQEAAADRSSTWSGGVPVTASPAGPYAYGSRSYEDSAAASANIVPKSSSLGLVPVIDERETAGSWNNDQPGHRQSSPYSSSSKGGGIQDDRFPTTSPPPGLTPLPPVDRSVQGPVLSPLADGSIPVYPSTEAL
jgi:hypothetical protein